MRGSTSSTCFSALGFTARIICQKTESQMSDIARTPAMHVDEAPLRIEARSLPPFSAPMSASSCRYVSRDPACERSRSVGAASRKKTYMREPQIARMSSEWPSSADWSSTSASRASIHSRNLRPMA